MPRNHGRHARGNNINHQERCLEGFTLPKILWVQEHEPEHWQQVRHMMLPKDFLAFWLSGTYSMDYSDAAGTLLLDIEKRCWSDKAILEKFAIASDLLPPLFESAALWGKCEKIPRSFWV